MNGTEMAEPKHQAIKLFGRKIPVPDTQMPASSLSKNFQGSCREVTKVKVGCSGDKDKPDNGSSDQEKVLKKPDKIVPCPRCNSLETKFCYFNNYNVNQPRHFCRNCQRYWTAGGAMRNVPVGAGRRKNKHLPTQFCQILATSDGIPVTSMESLDPATHHLHPCVNVEEPSLSGSSDAASKCTEQALILNANSPNHAQWSPAPVLAAQELGPSNIPLHFIPASYWGCVPVWASGTGNGSPNLGKHCRDSNLSEQKNPEKCLFAPKTKRIDHCNEASKSPLWDALGLKPDGKDAMPNESELLL